MGRSSASTAVFALLVTAWASQTSAHHSLAPYDRQATRTIEGVVKQWDFANPHVKLLLTVTGDDGSSTDWLFEATNVSRMRAFGFNRVSARIGDMLSVRYHPRRTGAPGGMFTGFTDSRGRSYGPVADR
jgi:hypothetical protein